MDRVIEIMRRLCPVSDESVSALKACVEMCEFPRRYQLVRAGSRAGYAFFIARGMTRSFWMEGGEEITTSFSVEGGIVFSMDELYYDEPSQEYVETMEPVVVYRIAIEDLRRLWETLLDLANWGRIIHQNEYRRLHRSHKERLTLSAKDRYEAFVDQFPEVSRRAQLGYVASYLGITLSTLSRLRADAVKRGF